MPRNTNADREALIELAPARGEMYGLLSDVFREPPTAERFSAISGDAFLSLAATMFSEETLALLRQYARSMEDAAELQRSAGQEFMNLFKVPGAQYVTPYESIFRDAREIAGKQVKGLLMGKCAVDVQKWYRLAALQIAEEHQDLPDHICLELSYLAHLCNKEQQFAASGEEAKLVRCWEMERDFLAAHVVMWIGGLRDRIGEKSKHAYFLAMAELAVQFTRRDLATLERVLGPSIAQGAPEYDELE